MGDRVRIKDSKSVGVIDKIEKEVEERHKKVPKFFQKMLGTDVKIKTELENMEEEIKKAKGGLT